MEQLALLASGQLEHESVVRADRPILEQLALLTLGHSEQKCAKDATRAFRPKMEQLTLLASGHLEQK
ncbi:hypothetical protein KI387_026774, partial [Taxus chinensis]